MDGPKIAACFRHYPPPCVSYSMEAGAGAIELLVASPSPLLSSTPSFPRSFMQESPKPEGDPRLKHLEDDGFAFNLEPR